MNMNCNMNYNFIEEYKKLQRETTPNVYNDLLYTLPTKLIIDYNKYSTFLNLQSKYMVDSNYIQYDILNNIIKLYSDLIILFNNESNKFIDSIQKIKEKENINIINNNNKLYCNELFYDYNELKLFNNKLDKYICLSDF